MLSLGDALLIRLASENRQVFADWRAVVLLRRATFDLPQRERRWSQLPSDPADLRPLFRQMRQRGETTPIGGFRNLFQVTVPYAGSAAPDDLEVFAEASPYGIISHLSAMVFHNMTLDIPKIITATIATDEISTLLPLGTTSDDWEGVPQPRGSKPARIFNLPVKWTTLKSAKLFGFQEYRPRGFPVRVTTPERTLLDGLQSPEKSGGISNVLHAWFNARYTLNVRKLVDIVDQFDNTLLRQRAGYILEELGMSDPRLKAWQALAYRGSSSVLVNSEPYAPTFSERWSLSLNGPVGLLHEEIE